MKIIKPNYEILPRTTGHDSILMIEKIARICYKSEDKIKEGSAEHMIAKLVDNGHFAMLEHRQIIVEVSKEDGEALYDAIKRIEMIYGQFSYLKISDGSSVRYLTCHYIVSGNMRAWFETCMVLFDEFVVPQWMFQILSKEEYVPIFGGLLLANEDKIKRGSLVKSGKAKEITNWNELTISERLIHEQLSVKFIVDRGVSHELVRHRPASFAQESTRYCNYGNSDNGITVIEPCFFDSHTIDRRGMITEPAHYKDERYPAWKRMMETAEKHYLWLVGNGATPQEARTVLPNSLKTEIVVTTTLSHWQHIFNLRAFGLTGAPHPQMKEVMEPLVYELMVSKEYDRIFTNPNTHK